MKLEEMLTRNDLSWKAKGLATTIALMADQFAQPGPNKVDILIEFGAEAESSIRSGLRELETAGILRMTRVRNSAGSGHVTGSTWEINVEWPQRMKQCA